jgi:hypothetical protein
LGRGVQHFVLSTWEKVTQKTEPTN